MLEINDSSYKTAIVRKSVSLPVKKLIRFGALRRDIRTLEDATPYRVRILDFGCGKGFDADFLFCDRFDPYYFPSLDASKRYDIILCTYVLNVVTLESQEKIVNDIIKLLDNSLSRTYISVRRDISVQGTRTQRYVELGQPFRRYHSYKGFTTYYATKQDLLESTFNKEAGSL